LTPVLAKHSALLGHFVGDFLTGGALSHEANRMEQQGYVVDPNADEVRAKDFSTVGVASNEGENAKAE